ncbi:MAG: protein rep [Okeania sp. SIO3H1]|nr:protein rep [Okeania sp. SIO3H1]
MDKVIVPSFSLKELSYGDRNWHMHKKQAQRIQVYYADFESELDPKWRENFKKYSTRISNCGNWLAFNIHPGDFETNVFKLKSAQFCRVRYCPMCQFRRAKMNQALMLRVTDKLVKDYPTYRFLFLTLTVPNCDIIDLRETLSDMNAAFQRLTQLKRWPGVGWIKSTEVTKGKANQAHPHFHCLIMVKSSYFKSKAYIKHDNRKKGKDKSEWLQLWNQCYRSDNIEALHVTAIEKGNQDQLQKSIFEVMKYGVKEADLAKSRNWLHELTKQTHRLRFIDKGGVFKDYFREVKDEPRSLIFKDEDDFDRADSSFDEWFFSWDKKEQDYLFKY